MSFPKGLLLVPHVMQHAASTEKFGLTFDLSAPTAIVTVIH